ncbi:MAG: hypothetical protein C4521_10815 [Actinobacteria bacterium]|nr:MAG: hypothetical protein C4521_10815 [Actinomycetota bacterium]
METMLGHKNLQRLAGLMAMLPCVSTTRPHPPPPFAPRALCLRTDARRQEALRVRLLR